MCEFTSNKVEGAQYYNFEVLGSYSGKIKKQGLYVKSFLLVAVMCKEL